MTPTDSTEGRLKEIRTELKRDWPEMPAFKNIYNKHTSYLLDLVEKYRSTLKLYEHISHKTGEKDVSKFSAAAEVLRV